MKTIRNSDICWSEHESTKGKLEPVKHLADNKSHMFPWKLFASAPLHLKAIRFIQPLGFLYGPQSLSPRPWPSCYADGYSNYAELKQVN